MALVRILSPESEPELALAVSLLEAHGVPCFVHNYGIGALFPGPQISSFNTRAIMVPEEHVATALELLQSTQPPPDAAAVTKPTGTLRALLELLLFGWFVPGSRRPVRDKANPQDTERQEPD